jgi:hypothetical protein
VHSVNSGYIRISLGTWNAILNIRHNVSQVSKKNVWADKLIFCERLPSAGLGMMQKGLPNLIRLASLAMPSTQAMFTALIKEPAGIEIQRPDV